MPALDIIASIASTVMSTIVAVVALVFTYRQNVGWQPVALVTHTMLSGTGGTWHHTLHLSVEIWNRRKFPVALRFAKAVVDGVDILDADSKGLDCRDFVRRNEAFKDLNVMIEPNGSVEIPFELSFENQSLDALRPHFDISISYFNPHKNQNETLTLEHRFFYPELGWKKSNDERQAALRAFEEIRSGNEALRESMTEKRQLRAMAAGTADGEEGAEPR